ncbi:MAG: hypothetical protein AB7N24_19205 [Dehalococcoidia bacterium]
MPQSTDDEVRQLAAARAIRLEGLWGPATSFANWATFAFEADPAGAQFECHLDGGPFESCATFTTYTGLAAGPHQFDVRVVSSEGTNPSTAWKWGVSDGAPPRHPG